MLLSTTAQQAARSLSSRQARRRRRPTLESLEQRRLLSYTVNDSGDAPLDLTKPPAETANGTITLRSAIEQVNIDGGGTITFNGALTINVQSGLDEITANGVTIEAPSQGSVIVDGGNGDYSGLILAGNDDIVKDLVVENFQFDGIALLGNSDQLYGNYIGTNASATTPGPNGVVGVLVYGSSNDTIGGTTAADRNIISGNTGDGIGIEGDGTTGNLVEGNYIGTDITGSKPLANGVPGVMVGSGVGVLIAYGATGNTVGGTTAAARNVISGNAAYGVQVAEAGTTGNVVEGNYIGLNAGGSGPLPNGLATYGGGVVINFGAASNTFGGVTAAARNIISGNARDGIDIVDSGTSNNLIEGNYVGLNPSGTAPLPNRSAGVYIGYGLENQGNATSNTIGGTTAGAANIISANGGAGVLISGSTAADNVVEGNDIGTNATGSASSPASFGNRGDGVDIWEGASGNTIGGLTATPGNAPGNVISNNAGEGVNIAGSGSDTPQNNAVEGNCIGADASGTKPLANTHDGIVICQGASQNTVGGTSRVARNIIAFNGGNGVTIGTSTTDQSAGDAVEGNSIFANSKLGIDLGDNGSMPNDSMGHQTGPNHWQNFPVLEETTVGGAIVAQLKSSPGTYRIEFFANTTPSPSGAPEGQTFLGFASLTVDSNGTGKVAFTAGSSVSSGTLVTATATSVSGDTSEFSGYPLRSGTFGGQGFHPITADDGSITYNAEQWLGGGNPHQWPVLYGSGSKLTVSAAWDQYSIMPVNGTILARATTSNGLTISQTPVTVQSGDLMLPPVYFSGEPNPKAAQATAPFGQEDQYFADFTIQWQLSFNGGTTWINAGQSDNPLYVSASANPQPDPLSKDFYLTVVNSEVTSTQGLTSGDTSAIVAGTWDLFTGRNFTNYAGQPLYYYKSLATQNVTVASLLQYHDGQCGAWDKLFLDMLMINGVRPAGDYVTVVPGERPPFTSDQGLLVKNWVFTGPGSSSNPLYPYIWTPTHGDVQHAKIGNIGGQNNPNPKAYFDNHQIAYINGTFYDPSYGVTYTSLLDMEKKAISGFYFISNGVWFVRQVTPQTAQFSDLLCTGTSW
jgi:hypothetical protein